LPIIALMLVRKTSGVEPVSRRVVEHVSCGAVEPQCDCLAVARAVTDPQSD
jgi:hypothetical protein